MNLITSESIDNVFPPDLSISFFCIFWFPDHLSGSQLGVRLRQREGFWIVERQLTGYNSLNVINQCSVTWSTALQSLEILLHKNPSSQSNFLSFDRSIDPSTLCRSLSNPLNWSCRSNKNLWNHFCSTWNYFYLLLIHSILYSDVVDGGHNMHLSRSVSIACPGSYGQSSYVLLLGIRVRVCADLRWSANK